MKFITSSSTTFVANWDLGRKCTYACSYCPPFRSNKTSPGVSLAEMIKTMDFIHEYIDLYDFNRKEPYYRLLALTGGEPTVHKDFFKFAKYVKDTYGDQYEFTFTSNGAFSKAIAKKCVELNLCGTISYHPEADAKSKKLVIDNILFFDGRFKVNVMFHKDYFDECIELCELLKSKNIPYLIRRIGDEGGSDRQDSINKGYVQIYSDEQEQWFADQQGTKTTKGGKECCGKRKLCTEEGPKTFIPDVNFQGWSCAINWYFLFINSEVGGIWTHQTCGVNLDGQVAPIGYLNDTDTILNDLEDRLINKREIPLITCPKPYCLCGMCVDKSTDFDKLEEIMQDKIRAVTYKRSDLIVTDRSEWKNVFKVIHDAEK